MRGIRQSLIKPIQLKGRGADCLFLFLSYERTLIKLFAVFLKRMCMPSEPHGEGDIAVELWKKLEPGEK